MSYIIYRTSDGTIQTVKVDNPTIVTENGAEECRTPGTPNPNTAIIKVSRDLISSEDFDTSISRVINGELVLQPD